jgi:zinc protease
MAIGENADLDTVTPADCQRFYDQFYQPGNATLIVVGDVTEADVRAQAEQAFGAIPATGPIPRSYPPEPPQRGYVEKKLELSVQIPIVVGGYRTPPAGSDDTPALEVLSRILSAGESSRLHQRLVRKDKLSVGAAGIIWPLEQPGLLVVFAAHLPKVPGDRVRDALLDEIERVRTDGVTEPELDKAKRQLLAEHVRQLESAAGIASALGSAQYIQGGWERFTDNLSRYEKVAAGDIERVAKKYLGKENLTMVMLVPGKAGGK